MKKLLSVFLVLAMFLSLMPAAVFAEEGAEPQQEEEVISELPETGEAAEAAELPEEPEPEEEPAAEVIAEEPESVELLEEEPILEDPEAASVTTAAGFITAAFAGSEIWLENDVTVTASDLANVMGEEYEAIVINNGFNVNDGRTLTFDGVSVTGGWAHIWSDTEGQNAELNFTNGAAYTPDNISIDQRASVCCADLTLGEDADVQIYDNGSLEVTGTLDFCGFIGVFGDDASLTVNTFAPQTWEWGGMRGNVSVDAGALENITGIADKYINVNYTFTAGTITNTVIDNVLQAYSGYNYVNAGIRGNAEISGNVIIPDGFGICVNFDWSTDPAQGSTLTVPAGSSLTSLGDLLVENDSRLVIANDGSLYAFNLDLQGTLDIAEYAQAYLFARNNEGWSPVRFDEDDVNGHYDTVMAVGAGTYSDHVYSGYDVYAVTPEEAGYYMFEGSGESYGGIGYSIVDDYGKNEVHDNWNQKELAYIAKGETARICLHSFDGERKPLTLKITPTDLSNPVEALSAEGFIYELSDSVTITADMLPAGSSELHINAQTVIYGDGSLTVEDGIRVIVDSHVTLQGGSFRAENVRNNGAFDLNGECTVSIDSFSGNDMWLEGLGENMVTYAGRVGRECVELGYRFNGTEITQAALDAAIAYAAENGYASLQFRAMTDAAFKGEVINVNCGFLVNNKWGEEEYANTVTIPEGCTVNIYRYLYQDEESDLIVNGGLNIFAYGDCNGATVTIGPNGAMYAYGWYWYGNESIIKTAGGIFADSFELSLGDHQIYSAADCYHFTPAADGYYLFSAAPADAAEYDYYGISLIADDADPGEDGSWINSAGSSLLVPLEGGKVYRLRIYCNTLGSKHTLSISAAGTLADEFSISQGEVFSISDTSAKARVSYTAPENNGGYAVGFFVSPRDYNSLGDGGENWRDNFQDWYIEMVDFATPAEGSVYETKFDRLIPGLDYVCEAVLMPLDENGNADIENAVYGGTLISFKTKADTTGTVQKLEFNDGVAVSGRVPDDGIAHAFKFSIPENNYADMYRIEDNGEFGMPNVYHCGGYGQSQEISGYFWSGTDIYVFVYGSGQTVTVTEEYADYDCELEEGESTLAPGRTYYVKAFCLNAPECVYTFSGEAEGFQIYFPWWGGWGDAELPAEYEAEDGEMIYVRLCADAPGTINVTKFVPDADMASFDNLYPDGIEPESDLVSGTSARLELQYHIFGDQIPQAIRDEYCVGFLVSPADYNTVGTGGANWMNNYYEFYGDSIRALAPDTPNYVTLDRLLPGTEYVCEPVLGRWGDQGFEAVCYGGFIIHLTTEDYYGTIRELTFNADGVAESDVLAAREEPYVFRYYIPAEDYADMYLTEQVNASGDPSGHDFTIYHPGGYGQSDAISGYHWADSYIYIYAYGNGDKIRVTANYGVFEGELMLGNNTLEAESVYEFTPPADGNYDFTLSSGSLAIYTAWQGGWGGFNTPGSMYMYEGERYYIAFFPDDDSAPQSAVLNIYTDSFITFTDPEDFVIETEKSAAVQTFPIVPAGELAKGSYKYVSSDTKVATVKEQPDGSAIVTVPANAYGTCLITVTSVKNKEIEASCVSVTVMDYTPRIGATAFTLNPYDEGSVETDLCAGYGKQIGELRLFTAAGEALDDRIRVEYGTQTIRFSCINSDLAAGSFKGALLRAYEWGTGEQLGDDIKINITIKPVLPKVTVKQVGKFCTFLDDAVGTVSITAKDRRVESVMTSYHEAYDFMPFNLAESTIGFRYKAGYDPAAVKAGMNFYVKVEGCRIAIPVTLKSVAVLTKQSASAKVSLGTSKVKFNSLYAGKGLEVFTTAVKLTGDGYSLTGVTCDDPNITVYYSGGFIIVNLNPGGASTKAVLKAQVLNEVTGMVFEMPLTLTVTVSDAPVTVKTSASGKLDTLVRGTDGVVYVPKFTNYFGTFSDVELVDASADIFKVREGYDAKGNWGAVVTLKEDIDIAKGNYTFTLRFKVGDDWVTTPVIKAPVALSKLKVTTPKAANYYQCLGASGYLVYELKVASPAGAKVDADSIALGKLTGVLEDAVSDQFFIDEYRGTTRIVICFNDVSGLKAGSTYKIPITLLPENAAPGTAPVNLTLSFKVIR